MRNKVSDTFSKLVTLFQRCMCYPTSIIKKFQLHNINVFRATYRVRVCPRRPNAKSQNITINTYKDHLAKRRQGCVGGSSALDKAIFDFASILCATLYPAHRALPCFPLSRGLTGEAWGPIPVARIRHLHFQNCTCDPIVWGIILHVRLMQPH